MVVMETYSKHGPSQAHPYHPFCIDLRFISSGHTTQIGWLCHVINSVIKINYRILTWDLTPLNWANTTDGSKTIDRIPCSHGIQRITPTAFSTTMFEVCFHFSSGFGVPNLLSFSKLSSLWTFKNTAFHGPLIPILWGGAVTKFVRLHFAGEITIRISVIKCN